MKGLKVLAADCAETWRLARCGEKIEIAFGVGLYAVGLALSFLAILVVIVGFVKILGG